MRAITDRGSLWELAVLCLLREEAMHPYRMQQLLKERHKDEVLALKRGSLYHAINRLVRSGLIEPVTVGREGRRPERTTYRLAPAGGRELVRWLRERIATPQREPPEFMASLSFLVYLSPRDAAARLEARVTVLETQIAGLGLALERLRTFLDRVNLIESEYQRAMYEAELQWVRKVVADLRSGRFTWDLEKILKAVRAASRTPPAKERGR